MSAPTMKLTVKIWRQSSPADRGKFVTYERDDVSPDQSFLEMLDDLNLDLIRQISSRQPGDEVQLKVFRERKMLTLVATLGDREQALAREGVSSLEPGGDNIVLTGG